MQKILALLVLFLVAVNASNDLNDLYFSLQENTNGKQLKFLQEPVLRGDPDIAYEDCDPNSVLQIQRMKVDPPQAIKGKTIVMKIQGMFSEKRDVEAIHVETFYNDGKIFEQDVPNKATVEAGPYMFEYGNNIPTFVPAGKWITFVYLMGPNSEKLCCFKAAFDMS